MQNDLNSLLGQTPAAGRRRRASGSIDPALHNKHNANGQRQIITPTRRSCPIHGLKPVVFTDTRLDRRVGGMEKCAHPRTEVRGFRRHFFIKTIILFEVLTILAMLSYYFFVPASTFEYTIVFDITDKGKTAGFDTTTESLVFGVLPRGAGATRFIDVETSSPQIIRIVPQGDFKGWMFIPENNFRLFGKKTIVVGLNVPAQAAPGHYEGKLRISAHRTA